jgi:hypothetical protein
MAKTKSTSGFIYIWRDKKHKRYYIGSHWGNENDGYICSCRWMRKAYNRRPLDFKRRIISKIYTSRKDLLEEENRWLSMIKSHELKIRYYNSRNCEFNHWSADDQKLIAIGKRISNVNKGKKQTFKDPIERGRKISESKKKVFDKRREETGLSFSPEHLIEMREAKLGKKHTQEWKDNNSKLLKEQWQNGIRIGKKRNRPHTDKELAGYEKVRLCNKNKQLSNDTKEKLSIRKTFKVNDILYENMTRKEICDIVNISYGSYYYEIKRGKILVI